jgi:spermidine synthase
MNSSRNLLIVVFALSGMAALIYEIIWIRPLSLVFGSTVYAVSTIISSFILGLAIGSWLAGKYSDRMQNPLKYFAIFQIGIGAYGVLLLPIFGLLPGTYIEVYNLTFPNIYLFQITQILMAMSIITIPATLMGTTLPLMIKTYSQNFSTIGYDVGKLDASNSMGAVFGTLAAGFLLLPLLGVQLSIFITAFINFSIGFSILATKRYVRYQYLIGVLVIIAIIFLFTPGYDVQTLNYGVYAYTIPGHTIKDLESYLEKQSVLFYKDSMYSTVMVTSIGETKALAINGKEQCNTSPGALIGSSLLSSLPYDVFVKNHVNPHNALVVGLGCGQSSKWLSDKVQTTTIEVDPAVVEASRIFFPEINHNLIIDDARNWLLRNDEKFDIITGQPQDPYENHGSLFTKEYFELLKNRLTEEGIVAQWVPMFEMTREDWYIFYNTFHSVFQYVYIFQTSVTGYDELILLGSQKPLVIDNNQKNYLGSHEKFNPIETILNTDDHNTLEYSTAINQYRKNIPKATDNNVK